MPAFCLARGMRSRQFAVQIPSIAAELRGKPTVFRYNATMRRKGR